MTHEQVDIKPGQLWLDGRLNGLATFVIVERSMLLSGSWGNWYVLWANGGKIKESNPTTIRNFCTLLEDVS